MDFSFFDAILDSVFVVGDDLTVKYSNEPAAALCESSVRRMQNKELSKFITFPDLDWSKNNVSPVAHDLEEIKFHSVKSGKEGLSQIAITESEMDGQKIFVIMVRDVTLEEVLHHKHHQQLKELENYSKNLEKMVAERTEEVRAANVMLNAIMDSLGQGFLVFDKKGVCSDFYTKACLQVLGEVPKQKLIWDVLKLNDKDTETFKMWIEAVFADTLPFDSLKDLATSQVHPTPEQFVDLDYYKIEDENPEKSKVVLVATDVTAEHVAKQKLEKEKQYAKMIVKVVANRNQFSRFLSSCVDIINQVTEKVQARSMDVKWALRQLHTLEGEAALFSIQTVWDESRVAQGTIQANTDDNSINDWPAVSKAMEDLNKTYLAYMEKENDLFSALGIGKGETLELTKDDVAGVITYLSKIGLAKKDLVAVEDQLLSQPIETLVSHYDEALKVVSMKLDKPVNPVVWTGVETQIRPERFAPLMSTLVHVFRNAVDHGVEPREDRAMMGKPEAATIHFNCEIIDEGPVQNLKIEISDDGQGIDVAKLRGRIVNSESLSDFEVQQKIFDSGLSSREEVSEFSGRGVGMNAVKEEAERLGGTVVAESEMGKGTIITIHVPLVAPNQEIKAA